MASLCPGFKHVENFGKDEDYEEEVEVSYVTLDLGNDVDRMFLPNASEYRLIGLDTSTPMIQVSGLFFKGAHEQLIGTELLFTDGRDENDLSRKFVVPFATTERRIRFDQVKVTAKVAEGTDEQGGDKPQGSRVIAKRREKGKGRGKTASQYETILDLDTSPSGDIQNDLPENKEST